MIENEGRLCFGWSSVGLGGKLKGTRENKINQNNARCVGGNEATGGQGAGKAKGTQGEREATARRSARPSREHLNLTDIVNDS